MTAHTGSAASALSSRGLPWAANLLRSFGPSISSAVTGFIHTRVHKIVTGPAFARTWDQVNRVAHAQLVKSLSGQGSKAKAQTLYRLINDLKIVLPILALVLLAAGVYIARGHRRP